MRKAKSQSSLVAPFLKRVWLDPDQVPSDGEYPFCLPFLRGGLDLKFDHPICILVGENGTGKSTLLEGIASLAGYDEAGGGKGYIPVDHSAAAETMGGVLSRALRAAWLPKITTGWFFRAESFFSVARYLDRAAREVSQVGPDYLSHSHGEGFLRFFQERCRRQGIFLFDEPESALSPMRQLDFLRQLRRMDHSGQCQVIMATHSPLLMAYPRAQLLQVSEAGLTPICLEDTDHFRLLSEFCQRPNRWVNDRLKSEE
ncbi:AAA family ATPase [bacterium]|nr:AAA family ATPase [bacterium]